MFDKKKSVSPPAPLVEVASIPAEFYGGSNPVIKFRDVRKEVDLTSLDRTVTPNDKRLHDQQTAKGGGLALHPARLFSDRRFLLILGIVLLVIIVGGTSAYYLIPYFQTSRPLPVPPTITPPSSTPSLPTTSINTIPVTSTPSSAPPVRPAQLEFPSILSGDSADTDNDGLTDREEVDVFNTDPGVPDTDNDGFEDGHEVYYLYNPAGKEPEKLIDAGLVKEYENPVWHYHLYYPTTWALGNIDNEYRTMLWSTLSGENVELRVIDKDPEQSFQDWFGVWAPREKFGDLAQFASYFKTTGYYRSDYLVYYFPTKDKVYVLLYHATPDTTVINYRSIIKMMARSFRLPDTSTSIVLPDLTTTSTDMMISPIPTSSLISTSSSAVISSSSSRAVTSTKSHITTSTSSSVTTSTTSTSR